MIRRINIKNLGEEFETNSNKLIEHLSLKVIKLRMDCLFSKNPKLKKCSCQGQFTIEHIISDCPKTIDWRTYWNLASMKLSSKGI